jgi:hypothetical protein
MIFQQLLLLLFNGKRIKERNGRILEMKEDFMYCVYDNTYRYLMENDKRKKWKIKERKERRF